MTHVEFGQILNEMIEGLPRSKNETIRLIEINRSTFYQFLNGKRFPTVDQITDILERAGFSEADQKKLRRAYDEAHYSFVAYRDIEIVRQCLEAVSESAYDRRYSGAGKLTQGEDRTDAHRPEEPADAPYMPDPAAASQGTSGTGPDNSRMDDLGKSDGAGCLAEDPAGQKISGHNETEHAILHLLKKAAEEGLEADCFLPVGATRFIMKNRAVLGGRSGRVRFLFRLSGKLDDIQSHSTPQFYDLIPMLLTENAAVRFFYGESDLVDGTGILFPYYILTDAGVLFLTSRLDGGFLTPGREVIRSCRDAYMGAFLVSEEASSRIRTLNDVRAMILSETSAMRSHSCMYMINHSPCMNMIATPELVKMMIEPQQQEAMMTYAAMIQKAAPKEIVTLEGLRSMVEEQYLEEYDYRIHAPKTVVHEVLLGLRQRLGKSFFIADGSHVSVPAEWSIFIVSDRSVTLIPQSVDSTAVSLYEKNILHGFSAALQQSLDYFILSQKTAEKILDHCLEKTEI